ncbi:hypothetical protein B0T09DRAFT_342091, partial [Sordaria sp. MPI-SDFR-AT-0083]
TTAACPLPWFMGIDGHWNSLLSLRGVSWVLCVLSCGTERLFVTFLAMAFKRVCAPGGEKEHNGKCPQPISAYDVHARRDLEFKGELCLARICEAER